MTATHQGTAITLDLDAIELEMRPRAKSIVDGESFKYLGRDYSLSIARVGGHNVFLSHGKLIVGTGVCERTGHEIKAWYMRNCRRWLDRHAGSWAETLGISPPVIEVRSLDTKLTCLGENGKVACNWAAVQLDPQTLSYVVARQLARLQMDERDPAFARVLQEMFPAGELRIVDTELWTGDIV